MILFFLIVLLTLDVLYFINGGGLFRNQRIKICENTIKNKRGFLSDEEFVKNSLSSILILLFYMLIGLIMEFSIIIYGLSSTNSLVLYLSTAYFVNIIIFNIIIPIKHSSTKKIDFTNEKQMLAYRKRIYGGLTFLKVIDDLIDIAYLVFMIYMILV